VAADPKVIGKGKGVHRCLANLLTAG